MGILFANNVNMQLAADLAADDTSFSVIAGQGRQCPEIAADSTDYMLLKIRNKNGLDEIVKIIEHELNSDTFIIGDSTEVPHTPSTDGRAYEKTFGGYQTALAIKASDAHKITMPVTAATLETALVVAGSGTTTDDFKKLHAITSTHTEINQLHESGVVKADLVKLHGITSTHTEINQLHGSGVVKADLAKLHGITSTHTEINQLHGSGVVKADLAKLHGITVPATRINTIGKIKARAYRNAAQDISANGYTRIAIDTVSFDTDGVVNIANRRIIPNLPGFYIVMGNVMAIAVPDGRWVTAAIFKNGALVTYGTQVNQGAAGYSSSSASDLIYMNGTTDYLELCAHNINSYALPLYMGNSFLNYISIVGPF